MASAKKDLKLEVIIENERILEILEDLEIKPSQAKVNTLRKVFEENLVDYMETIEETVCEILSEIAEEEWGE